MSESSRLLSPASKQALPVRAGSSESFDEDNSSSTIPSSSKGKTSLVLTAMTFANGVVGAGIIGLPGALNQAGFTAGIILCVLVAVLSAWTLRVLADTGTAHGLYSYHDLMQRAFGPSGYYFVNVFQALFAFGAMCTYLVIFADTVPSVLLMATNWKQTAPIMVNRQIILLIGSVSILIPLSLLRQYGHLANVSVIKMFAISVLTGSIIYFKFDPEIKVASVKTVEWKYTEIHENFFPALGTISFAFVCHHQAFLAHGSMYNPTQRRFALMVNLAVAMSFSLSVLVACFGYSTFFETTTGDIFINYDNFEHLRSNGILVTARLLLALNMLVTYPSEMMVLRNTVESLIDRRRRHSRWLALQAPVHDIALLAQLRQQENEEEKMGANAWKCGTRPTWAVYEHFGVTLGLYFLTLLVALYVEDLNSILSVTGSFTAVMLAFILPAAIRLRLGKDPYDEEPLFSFGNVPLLLLLVFGVIVFVASTGFSLVAAFT
jgi:sodium-coupled neutral amino acid transporter 11